MSFSLSTQCHMSFTFLNELPSPAEIKQNYPLSDKLKALKKERDAAISAVITGADSRFLVIIGPCSADNEDSVCDYVSRLTSIQEDVADKLILIPRVYTNKPRTTGEGYKGIPGELIEAAQIDGANKGQLLKHVIIPMVMPSITICTFLTLTNSFKLFDQNLALTNGEPSNMSEMLALNIYNTFYGRTGWEGVGQAKAVIFFILVGAIAMIQNRLTRSKEVQQ